MELICQIQKYEWGKLGSSSKVASLFKSANKDFQINEQQPYAELWMGTHVNAPSFLKQNNETLLSAIKKNPEFLGTQVQQIFGTDLPFLFKVLSVKKALSIQAHPSKKHAEQLHAQFPDIYKDPNHKPELAIALTEFEALCGFRPFAELENFFEIVPELSRIVDWPNTRKLANEIEITKEAFRLLLTATKETVTQEITNLLLRQKNLDEEQRIQQIAPLIERLNSQFPNDVGVLVAYFLNYLVLQPGEAIYLAANIPHAYLSGDCIECMACSDNVVRAGLTPKLIDIETLHSMLIYEGNPPSEKIFKPVVEDEYSKMFKPPVPDFAVVEIKVPKEKEVYSTIKRSSASILLLVSGKGTVGNIEVVPGSVLFLPADEDLTIELEDDVVIYQALANL